MPSKSWVDTPMTKDELACIYAALILADDDISITGEKITTLLNAADIDVDSIWPSLFGRALDGVDIRQLVVGAMGATTGPSGGGATVEAAKMAATQDGTTEEKKEEPKKEEPEEGSSDEDMGLGLFD